MNGAYLLLATVLACAFLAGSVLSVPAASAKALAGYLELPERRVRGLRTLLVLLMVPMMPISGLVVDKWGVQTLLLLGALLAALAPVVLERAGSPPSALTAVMLLAGAGAALINGSLLLMPLVFFPDNPVRSVNLGSLVIFLGMVLTPPLVRKLGQRLEAQKLLLLLGLVCLVPATLVACSDALVRTPPAADMGWLSILSDYRLALLALMAVLICPLDAALAGWVRRYVVELGYLKAPTTVMWGGLWIAFLGSRLLTGLFLPHGGGFILLLVLGLVAGITFGNMLSEFKVGGNGLGLWLAGACCGPLLPTLLGLVVQMFAGNPAPALGVVQAAGLLSMVGARPFLERSPRTALRWSTLQAVLMLAPALVLALTP